MGMLLALMLIPSLNAAGIYRPHVLDHNGRCIAEPGSYAAYTCPINSWNANYRCRSHGECPLSR
jgi:hypothetical protein